MNIKVGAFTVSQKSYNTKSETESRPPDKNVYFIIILIISQPKTYVVGTQKNRLNETVFFQYPKHMFKLIGKEIN